MSNEPAVGIDLGTTFSVVAHLHSSGRHWTIPNSEGDLITPSVVFFDGDTTVVGKEAMKAASALPDDIAQFVKRDMGSAVYGKPIHGERLPPEMIQSFILAKLRRDATNKLGDFSRVVVTVPAFFNEPRRKATQDAGAPAGLEVLDIINEPTAAAIAFGVQQGFLTAKAESKQHEKILVCDLGGGTFDMTLMEIDGSNYNAIATASDVYLGGIDRDRRIANYVADEFAKKNRGIDPRQNPAGLQRLLREAEEAKRTLSARDQTTITFDLAGDTIRVPFTRQQFEEMTADLLDRTRFTVVNLMQDAGLRWDDVTYLLLVGGSTRMPMVGRMLEEVSGKKLDRSLSADESVAHGAAIYAGLILASGSHPAFSVRNVNSHNLGVLGIEPATGRPRNQVMIARNTPLPASKTALFCTHRPNQSSVAVNVVEGGDASGNDSTPIGKCVVRDLPPGLPAETSVEVTFRYEQNGRLTVKARLPGLNKEAASVIERTSGMTPDTLRDWNRRLKHAEEPPSVAAIAGQLDDEPPPLPVLAVDDEPPPLPDVDEPPPLPDSEEPPPLPESKAEPCHKRTAFMRSVILSIISLLSSSSFAADLKITVSDSYRVISDKVTNDQSIVVLRRNPLACLTVYDHRTYLVQAQQEFTPIKETPVIHPSGIMGSYDEEYVGIGGAVQLRRNKIVAVFHGEQILPKELQLPGKEYFKAIVGAAVSTDGGFTFKKLGPAITSWRDEPWKPGVKHCLGNADPTMLVDHTGKYLLCYYGEHSRKNPVTGRWRSVITCVARSKISDEGRPGTWHKYFEGEFGEPGLKGKDTQVVNCWCPNVQYLPQFKKYILLGCRGGIVFSQSDDGIHWKKIEYLWQIADIPVKEGAWDQHPCFYVTRTKAGVVQGYLFYQHDAGVNHQGQGKMTFRAKTFRLTVEDEP